MLDALELIPFKTESRLCRKAVVAGRPVDVQVTVLPLGRLTDNRFP